MLPWLSSLDGQAGARELPVLSTGTDEWENDSATRCCHAHDGNFNAVSSGRNPRVEYIRRSSRR
jgi:hypothetical protein